MPLHSDLSGDVIRVFLADGTFKNVGVDAHTTVRRIIDVVLDALGVDHLSVARFALRLNACQAQTSGADSDDCHWLHPTLRFAQLTARYLMTSASSNAGDSAPNRFELRVRFLAGDVLQMYQTEMSAFLYLYEQLTADYLRRVAWKISAATALEMAALMIRKRFPNLNKQNVKKKLDFVQIEREGGFSRYLPETLVINTKRKQLQKTLIAEVRRVAGLSELECVFRFMRRLADVTPFDVEVFRAAFGTKWQNPVDIHISPNVGIAYLCENTRILVKLAALRDVRALCVRRVDLRSDSTALVELRLLADAIPLILTLPTMNIAESLAHLIDGYRVLLADEQESPFRDQNEMLLYHGASKIPFSATAMIYEKNMTAPPVGSTLETLAGRTRRRDSSDSMVSWAMCASIDALASKCWENDDINDRSPREYDSSTSLRSVNTRDLQLQRLIGEGQFGNVYSALYSKPGVDGVLPVAVKVCKAVDDPTAIRVVNEYISDEARAMSQFRHPHVITLIGTATVNGAIWLVMELATGGELRGYLQRERGTLPVGELVALTRQLADALTYLHRMLYVHGDVAARNCLVAGVSTGHCFLKLSDFGLSRSLAHEDDVYTAPHGKLPIKWLPPESINNRAFSTASDMFMFGVCCWEIFSWGAKPWPGVRNHEVIARVKRGEWPRKPDACPEAVYALMMVCWSTAATRRPRARDVFAFLDDVGAQLSKGVSPSELNPPGIFEYRGTDVIKAESEAAKSPSQSPNFVAVKRSEIDKDSRQTSNPMFTLSTHRQNSNMPKTNDEKTLLNAEIEAPSEDRANTLTQILEAQRAVCAADDRWLEEEEETRWGLGTSGELQRCSVSTNEKRESPKYTKVYCSANNRMESAEKIKQHSNSPSSENRSPTIDQKNDASPTTVNFDNAPFDALVRLVGAIRVLSESYSAQSSNDKWKMMAQDVSDKCKQFLSLSQAKIYDSSTVNLLPEELEDSRRRVQLVCRLIESDAKKFHDASKSDRRDALRRAHVIAVDGRSLLEALDADSGRQRRRAASEEFVQRF